VGQQAADTGEHIWGPDGAGSLSLAGLLQRLLACSHTLSHNHQSIHPSRINKNTSTVGPCGLRRLVTPHALSASNLADVSPRRNQIFVRKRRGRVGVVEHIPRANNMAGVQVLRYPGSHVTLVPDLFIPSPVSVRGGRRRGSSACQGEGGRKAQRRRGQRPRPGVQRACSEAETR
jgi:hypothetical protein